MKKIYIILLSVIQLSHANDNCLDKLIFNLSRNIDSVVNRILKKVCAIRSDSTQNNSCCEILSAQIDSCCENLSAQIDSCCEQLSSQIDLLETSTVSCEPTPITSATTISEPGTYCMANDIDGNIAITADAAILDMNGHTLTTTSGDGITVTGDKVEVSKGRLIGTGGGVNGITVSGASGFRLRDMEINDFSADGIELISDANGGMIENINIKSCATAGIEYVACDNIITKNVMVSGPGTNGFLLNTSTSRENLEFDTCQARGCTDGFAQIGSVSGIIINLLIRNCESDDNDNNGFQLAHATGFIIEDSIASNNSSNGFVLTSSPAGTNLDGTVKKCIATGNEANGFVSTSAPPIANNAVLFISNQAVRNTLIGFSIIGNAMAYNNYSRTNGTNYGGVTPIELASSVTTDTGWWTNVAT